MTKSTTQGWLEGYPLERGVYLLSPPSSFEDVYGRVRKAERRILTDEEVAMLPVGDGLWNEEEWRIRKRGANRLIRELARSGTPQRILEVGCGNGWLTALLQQNGHDVIGMDVFTEELEQAARVFASATFIRADLFTSELPKDNFDVIVFAASFQYIAEPVRVLERCVELLTEEGVVHILDTILYPSPAAAKAALIRSDAYYEQLGFPEMSASYHAHTLETIKAFAHTRVLSTPNGMDRTLARFGRTASPFTHVVVEPQ